ncbi:hypothetical protein AVEN_249160-1 [Araneus ventricosus]|uniref:Uncharacterized protein n=1 Tax=Araneus ventricosus TaxID=182803 RepID=A0A4Y2D623_ARAVE|nr:hypothetical protein AVEN_249160-1 [Araneus ventricosus]
MNYGRAEDAASSATRREVAPGRFSLQDAAESDLAGNILEYRLSELCNGVRLSEYHVILENVAHLLIGIRVKFNLYFCVK